MTNAQHIIQRHKAAESIRLAMCSIWRDVAAHADPLQREIGIDTATGWSPTISAGASVFDSTIREAVRVYSAGNMSWLTPSETTWFAFNPPHWLRGDDAAKSWFSTCTDIAREVLAGTNFYAQIHGIFDDDGIFGTCGTFMREDSRHGLHFERLPIGDYSILENERGEVDTLFRIYRYTARKAAQAFGENNLPSEVVAKLGDATKADSEEEEYLHFVGPREKRDRFKRTMANAPIASLWIHRTSQRVVKESGFLEQPFAVHRHLPFSRCPYGRSPAMEAIFDARQLNYMQQQLDTLVERIVTPPVIAPASFEGVIDLRARGVTLTPDMQQAPRFWEHMPTNYSIGEDRTEFRKRQINNSFHVELFQALASVPVGKEMTAEEVRQRRADRLPNFSPTYARKMRELIDPVLRMVFSTLLRLGAFPEPPRSLVQILPNGDAQIPDPKIAYTSRMALALQSIHNDAFLEVLNLVGQIAVMKPEIADNFDIDEGSRTYARNAGLLEAIIVPEIKRDQMRQQRAEQQAQAEAEASMLEEADSVSKLAGAMG